MAFTSHYYSHRRPEQIKRGNCVVRRRMALVAVGLSTKCQCYSPSSVCDDAPSCFLSVTAACRPPLPRTFSLIHPATVQECVTVRSRYGGTTRSQSRHAISSQFHSKRRVRPRRRILLPNPTGLRQAARTTMSGSGWYIRISYRQP